MKIINLLKKTSLCILLAIIALSTTACGSKESDEEVSIESSEGQFLETDSTINAGAGDSQVEFTITVGTGEVFGFNLKTDETTVGQAIETEGIAVLAADGTIAKALNQEPGDGKSWNFYVDGQLSSTSIKDTAIEEGKTYGIVLE